MVNYYSIFNFTSSFLILIMSILFFNSYFSTYKKKKIKEDYLIVEKTLFTFLGFFFYIINCLYYILNDTTYNENVGNITKTLSLIQLHCFNIFIPAFFIIRLFMSLEFFLTFKRPNHIFNSIIYNYKNKFYYEIIILIISLGIYFIDLKYYSKNIDIIIGENNLYLSPFYLFDFFKWSILSIFSFISFSIYLNTFKLIKNFVFRTQKKLVLICKKNIFLSFLYITYSIIQGIGLSLTKINQKNNNIKNYDNFNLISSISSLILILIDYIIEFYYLSISKFAQYKLKKTIIGLIGSKFRKEENNINNIPIIKEQLSLSLNSFSSSFSEEGNDKLIALPGDEDLISCYNNGYIFEDYIFDYYDTIINISLISIFNIYQTSQFSKRAQSRKIRKAFDISNSLSISGIPGGNFSSNLIKENTYKFKINNKKNDFKNFDHVLSFHNQDFTNKTFSHLNVDITVFNVSNVIEILNSRNLNLDNVVNSIISHMKSKEKNIIESLISTNIQDKYFQFLTNMNLKTKDKEYQIEIFHTKMNDFSENFDNLLERYFFHIGSNPSSFLPIILGVFKIKINNFIPLLIIITKNSLIENSQNDTYSFWQLVRFDNNKKVLSLSSSQNANDSLIVKDDPIFERTYEVETKKDNPNLNKIILKNYDEFIDILNKDIQCLKLLKIYNFKLLMMYYEYENTQKHEKGGKIIIKKKGSKAEIIAFDSIPEVNEKESFTIPNDDILDNDNFVDNNDNNKNSNKNNLNNAINSIDDEFDDISDDINISSFDGTFHHFNCLCYFMFENLFDISKFLEKDNFYDEYSKNIMNHFVKIPQIKK